MQDGKLHVLSSLHIYAGAYVRMYVSKHCDTKARLQHKEPSKPAQLGFCHNS